MHQQSAAEAVTAQHTADDPADFTSNGEESDSATVQPVPHVCPQDRPTPASMLQEGLQSLISLEQSLEPAKDLADVSHRLKKLEKAVKSHLLSSRVAGDASIIASSAGGQPAGAATTGSPLPSRVSERAQLRNTLSAIKADVADLAAKEVEAQLLQQRVARLEAVIGGLTITPGFASGLTSFAGSLIGAPGLVPASQGQRMDASPRMTRAPSGRKLHRQHS